METEAPEEVTIEAPKDFKEFNLGSKFKEIETLTKAKKKKGKAATAKKATSVSKKAPTKTPTTPRGRPRRSTASKYASPVVGDEEVIDVPDAQIEPPQEPPRKKGRSPRVDLIDLVTSPPLILPGVVNLDSDEEDELRKTRHPSVLEASFDDLNYEISVKVLWCGENDPQPMKYHQPFGDLMKKIAEREGTDAANVVLMVGDRILSKDDTPAAINYKITQFITGRVVAGKAVAEGGSRTAKNKNMIKVKVQAAGLKKPLEVTIDKTSTFAALMSKCAESLKADPGKMRLKFDGEIIKLSETPNDLDFEGGEVIDCLISK